MRAAELPNAPYRSAGAGYYSNGYPSATLAYEDPLAAGRRAHEFPAPLNGLELQPSEACPKNYVIFDQTCTKSRVTFHPTLAHKLVGSSSSGHDGTYRHGAVGAQDAGAARGGRRRTRRRSTHC
ncbi:hypothetical protein SEVIR_1G140666v4 [Setaria viridis]|uniref:Uncharacterized protein n=1 Tax=Setaria viridis TaxID=4556 RepID=A0A4U6WCU0_SETVI|nr:hypothetical protein SEVIR_1G140666v2 [Setaria viridis]